MEFALGAQVLKGVVVKRLDDNSGCQFVEVPHRRCCAWVKHCSCGHELRRLYNSEWLAAGIDYWNSSCFLEHEGYLVCQVTAKFQFQPPH